MNGHPSDDLAAYALGVLDAPERESVERHVSECQACRDEVAAFAETAWSIAQTAALDTPSGLRESIVARATRDSRPLAAPRSVSIFDRLIGALRRPIPVAVPLAIALLLVGSLAGLAGARRDADDYAKALSGVAGAHVVPLSGTETALRGSVVVPASGAPAYLILDLPAPPSGKVWEAWILNGERPIAAGIADRRSGVTTVLLTAPLGTGNGVAVTLEPAGGSLAPTTAPVLAGRT
ncbi:MAG TPA: anti-sigma factor [Candidatus Saccharimonadales bacterium]|nr:anti-sigma factor [Candidatus Saccharimonadales bacterium]